MKNDKLPWYLLKPLALFPQVLLSLMITMFGFELILSSSVKADVPKESLNPVHGFLVKGKEKNFIDDNTKSRIQENYGKLPLYFIKNTGQLNNDIKYYENGHRHAVFFTEGGVYLELSSIQKAEETVIETCDVANASRGVASDGVHDIVNKMKRSNSLVSNSELIKLIFVGANKDPEIIAERLQEYKVNYFIGKDTIGWKTNIPTYASILYKEIYEGIDLRFHGNNRQLEYDIIVKPDGNLSHVRFAYQGVDGIEINKDGDLEISLKGGKIIQKKPYIYQEIDGKKVSVEGRFKIENSKFRAANSKSRIQNQKFIYSFRVASYDRRYPLVVDPALVYSTYLGGSGSDQGCGIAVDSSGNAYITGFTASIDFPTASAAYPNNAGGTYETFVTKLNDSGSSLVFSTYIGGSDSDQGYGVAVDSSGNVIITGLTASTDFPVLSAIYGSYNGGTYDGFVTKLDSSGGSLAYSTYLGGSGTDVGRGVVVDTSGNAFITGYTSSTNFPTLSALYNSNAGGTYDAFVTEINSTGASLVYSTYLGGAADDQGRSIAVDTSGNAYITGITSSADFPTSSAIYGGISGGTYDAFVSKLNGSGTSFVYSTYLGGSGSDQGTGITADTSGNSYVTGYTTSNNFPIASAIYGSFIGGTYDAFVAKLNSSGNNLDFSTFLGGSGDDYSSGIVADTSGNTYISGYTTSTNFPTTSAIYGSNAGSNDLFIVKLNSSGSNLVYSTYMGGSSNDYQDFGRITIDTSGNVYITGYTTSTNFPTTSAIYESYAGGTYDAVIAKITFADLPSVTTEAATNVTSNSATLNGTVNPNGLNTSFWFNYGVNSGSYNGTTTVSSTSGTSSASVSTTIDGLSEYTTYYCRLAAQNNAGSAYGSETTFTTQELTAPSGSISINNDATYTNSIVTTVTLSATDNVGVTGYYLSDNPTTPSISGDGWASVESTTSFTGSVSYTLINNDGSQTVYVWYRDAVGNISDVYLDSITLDTVLPTVTITSPTSNDTYTTTGSFVALGGSATDETSGIASVTWSSDQDGSGSAFGTTSWLTAAIPLSSENENTITVTATDNAGNLGTDTITVTFVTETPTVTATPTETPTTTPESTPITECDEATAISANPTAITLEKKESSIVILTVTGEDDCRVAGDTIKARVDENGEEFIKVSPKKQTTDINGQVAFTIKAKNKQGTATVTFKDIDSNLSTTITVTVEK
ncbi:MAG TPA: beta strand repeat-containing protein [Candidatus Wujingus californicus]|uniref:beta strand repeat-containing protein n=3 Tax=Candidatus Wujingus californicus TaxID=3367618 RepID=UPI001DF77B5F|nr:SBBP repeat-containing protein [Planctomycetota bacterium]